MVTVAKVPKSYGLEFTIMQLKYLIATGVALATLSSQVVYASPPNALDTGYHEAKHALTALFHIGGATPRPAQSAQPAASSPPSAVPRKVANFAVAGVHLGMGYHRAEQALTAFLHVSASSIESQGKIASGVPASISVHVGHGRYIVHFAHRTPPEAGHQAVVDSIVYELMPYTPRNAQAMTEVAIRRYGQPTTPGAPGAPAEWCSRTSYGVCLAGGPVLECCSYHLRSGKFMTSVKLSLSDSRYETEWTAYEAKTESSTPVF